MLERGTGSHALPEQRHGVFVRRPAIPGRESPPSHGPPPIYHDTHPAETKLPGRFLLSRGQLPALAVRHGSAPADRPVPRGDASEAKAGGPGSGRRAPRAAVEHHDRDGGAVGPAQEGPGGTQLAGRLVRRRGSQERQQPLAGRGVRSHGPPGEAWRKLCIFWG